MQSRGNVKFDLEAGKKMTDSFYSTSGVSCRLYTERGDLLYERGEMADSCAVCRKSRELTGEETHCDRIHIHGALQARRFGGRYIYFCPFSMAYFSSPIMVGGALAGALVGGPVLIMDIDEYLDGDLFLKRQIPREKTEEFRRVLASIPQMEPARLSQMSEQLFASALYVSDSSHEMFMTRSENRQQDTIGEYIQRLKTDGPGEPYPVDKERELSHAVTQGDKKNAGRLLNELLGHIMFRAGSEEVLRSRVTELLVVMSRAAIEGGSGAEQILEANHRYLGQLRRLSGQEDMARWLADVLGQFTNLVFGPADTKHGSSIQKALEYINSRYAEKLTLAEVAEYAGYSPAYFSKVFREERGCTFREYLNELRVEKSKTLLLSGHASIAEICAMVGFEDQSYFGKVFRKFTGVTPDRYRKRSRRIDSQRERGQ